MSRKGSRARFTGGTMYIAAIALRKALDGQIWPVAPAGRPVIVKRPLNIPARTWYQRVFRAKKLVDEWMHVEDLEPYTYGLRFRIIGGEVFVARDAVETKRFWPTAVEYGFDKEDKDD